MVAIETLQQSCVINGVATECVVSKFKDRWLVGITQIGKIGMVIEAAKDRPNTGQQRIRTPQMTQTYSVEIIFGKRDMPNAEVLARRLVEVAGGMSLLITLSLKKGEIDSFETLKQVATLFETCIASGDNSSGPTEQLRVASGQK